MKTDRLSQAATTLNRAAPPGERLAFVNRREERGLKAAGGRGKPSAGGVPSYKKGDVEAPPPRDYEDEIFKTTRAQVKLAPELYAAEERFRGKYAQLDMDIAKQMTPQLLDLYETSQRRLGTMDREQLDLQRGGDISAIEKYGGRARAAIDAANPEQAALLAELNQQAQEGLEAGGQLSAWQRREIQQSARSGQAARGMGYGVGDAAIESLAQLQGASARQQQRQGFAQSMVGINKATAADPFMAILGRPSSLNPMMSGGVIGQAGGYNPGAMFSPESQYAGDIYNQNYQGELAARTASARNAASIMGAGMGMFGSVLGGAASSGEGIKKSIFGCWVAREVFGNENPQWLAFYDWKESKAPKWFKKLYDSFGERFAKFISNKPKLKKLIKTWMEDKINA